MRVVTLLRRWHFPEGGSEKKPPRTMLIYTLSRCCRLTRGSFLGLSQMASTTSPISLSVPACFAMRYLPPQVSYPLGQDAVGYIILPPMNVPKATLADENPLLGTWKLQSLVFEATATGQRSSPFGDHPDGYLSYSADDRMYAIGVAGDRPKPRDLVPTDEEKVKLQESMFAYAGTYTADGEKVVHHVDVSWNQSWTGTDLVRFYKLDGNTLTITTARAQSAIDGEEGEFILVWEKVQ
jgi:Lipocalin-like domain